MLDKTTAKWAAKMLDLAGQEFSNHGCNDFVIDNTPDNLAFVVQIIAAGDDPDDEPNISDDGESIYLMDWMVMSYCQNALEAYANET